MKSTIQFIILFALWLLLTWSVQLADIIAGIVISILAVALMGDIFTGKMYRILNPIRLFWMVVYIPYLFLYIILANLDVAYRVINPAMPIRPGIVRFKTNLKSEIGKTFLANSITLTPGTLTVDIIGDEFFVHWINVRCDGDSEKQGEIIAGKFERILGRIFE
ncbi:Na+/H+ antiporter subunit E [bacterium]|nr:MAG: Na+/H+ antiporter subunit E [bacterium]